MMKPLKNLLEVSILGDIDDQIKYADTQGIKLSIEKWIKENYDCTGLKISDKSNKDGLYEVTAHDVKVKSTNNISLLTNGMFEWKKVKFMFDCSYCPKLESLEGAPKEVGGNFYCYNCASLESLEGSPKKVGKNFCCNKCNLLESLEGAPTYVGGNFYCSSCKSLKTLKGAPKKVKKDFDCSFCKYLNSLEGAPKEVGQDFECYFCAIKFIEEEIRKISKVKGDVFC